MRSYFLQFLKFRFLFFRTDDLPLTVSEFRHNLDTYLIIYILIGTFMMLCSFIQVKLLIVLCLFQFEIVILFLQVSHFYT